MRLNRESGQMNKTDDTGASKGAPYKIGEHTVADIGDYQLFYIGNNIRAIPSRFISKIGDDFVIKSVNFIDHLIDVDLDLVNWVGKTTMRIHFEHPLKDRTLCGMKYSRAFRLVEGGGANSLECRRCEKIIKSTISKISKDDFDTLALFEYINKLAQGDGHD